MELDGYVNTEGIRSIGPDWEVNHVRDPGKIPDLFHRSGGAMI